MKTLFVLLVALSSMTTLMSQETETVKATFNEYADGIYHFTDKDSYSMEFEYVEQDVLAQFDLSGEAFKGKLFIVTYQADSEEDQDGEAILVNTIIGLKLAE